MNRIIKDQKSAVVVLCMICTLLCFSCKSTSSDENLSYYYEEQINKWASGGGKIGLCSDELCLYYQQVWKELFLEETGFTEEYFNEQIEVYGTEFRDERVYSLSTMQWLPDGITIFYIYYKIKCDWANTYEKDFFAVKSKEGSLIYELLPDVVEYRYIDTYLTKEVLRDLYHHPDGISGKIAFSIWDTKIPAYENLKFDSFQAAMDYLSRKANATILNIDHISINVYTGHWMLKTLTGTGTNNCIFAELNLNTGETDIRKASCNIP